jgi:predicted AAA+ superfamily ATPase
MTGGAFRLTPWPEVVRPHRDVASGDVALGTYAANLAAAVLGGEGPPVYVEAEQFFAATYFTTAMRSLLGDVLDRLAGGAGDRVMQLQTYFGGGKTHALLALYHVARNREAAAGVPELDGLPYPGAVHTAVLSGEYLDPQRGREVEGRRIATLWGELAYQLGGWAAYDALLVDGDEGVPPGGERLDALLGDEPSLVLLDEVLTYVVKGRAVQRGDTTVGQQTLLFVQNLTEAVSRRPRAALVYSLQASVGEAMSEETLLAQLEKIGARVDQRREPVSGDEVLRVVQRRLFEQRGGEEVRRTVAREYARQLGDHLEATAETDGDRAEARRAAAMLEQRIVDAYPFHPELIDLMSHRWGTLPTYQRTRGALQFLARVVHTLWAARGERVAQALIGPGDVDLAEESVREGFLEQVGEANQYRSVVEADFLSADAGTKRIDERIGRDAPALERLRVGTRVASAIMLLSFGGQHEDQRGALEREVIEATLAPGLDANNIREALREMEREALLYLHHRGSRYRFDTVANINSLIRGEREGLSKEEVLTRVREELERELERGGERREVVVWAERSAQIRDEGGRFRIVYLAPEWTQESLPPEEVVMRHGEAVRLYRNGLAFARPSLGAFDAARRAARTLLAIERLQGSRRVSLKDEQRDDLSERANEARKELTGAMPTAYDDVLLPREIGEGQEVLCDTIDLRTVLGAGRHLHGRVHEALASSVFDRLTASRLAALAKLEEEPAWCEQLAESFWRYLERPKLWSTEAIKAAIADGVANGVFVYATSASTGEAGEVLLDGPSRLRSSGSELLRAEEVELGPGAVLLSLAAAERLRPADTASAEPVAEGGPQGPTPMGGGAEDGAPAPGSTRRDGVSSVSIHLRATEDDLHTLQRALSALRDLVRPGNLRIELTVAASSGGEPIDRVAFANRVQEPLDEDPDVEVVSVQWVDEGAISPDR